MKQRRAFYFGGIKIRKLVSVVLTILFFISIAFSGCIDKQVTKESKAVGLRIISEEEFSNSTLTEENISTFLNGISNIDSGIDPRKISGNILYSLSFPNKNESIVEVTFPPLNVNDNTSIKTIAEVSTYVMRGLFKNPSVDGAKLIWVNLTSNQGTSANGVALGMNKQTASNMDWSQYREKVLQGTYMIYSPYS